MAGDIIQVDYNQLEQIAQRFAHTAETTSDMDRRLRQAVAALTDGGWIGRGSDAFLQEMNTEVLPAHARLIAALQEGVLVTRLIGQTMRQAEAEAAALFQGGQGGGESATSGTTPGTTAPTQSGSTTQPVVIPSVRPGGSIMDHIKLKIDGTIWQFDKRSNSGKFDPGVKLTVGFEGALHGKAQDGMAFGSGQFEGGLKFSAKDGVLIGAGGEFYSVKGEWDTAFVGNKEYGITGSAGFKGPGGEAFLGVKLDGEDPRIGGTVGGNLISVDGSVGGNIAGHNISVTGEVGLKAEIGFDLSKKGVEIKLPFVSFGLRFGEGRD